MPTLTLDSVKRSRIIKRNHTNYMWENSIFNDDRSPMDSFQNRDSDTHMELTRDDLMNPREQTEWEKDLVEAESAIYSTSEALEYEPDLDQ